MPKVLVEFRIDDFDAVDVPLFGENEVSDSVDVRIETAAELHDFVFDTMSLGGNLTGGFNPGLGRSFGNGGKRLSLALFLPAACLDII